MKQRSVIFKHPLLLLVGVVGLFLSIRQIYGEDIGFHLHTARWMIEHFSFPDKEAFTYTANENAYIDLNWLYQLLMYGIYAICGGPGIILFNSAVILGSLFLLFRRINCLLPTSDCLLHPWLLLLSVITSSALFEIRPHSVSWLLLSVVLYILQKYYNGNSRLLRWLPLVMLIWVNMHSLFVLGLVGLGCYAVSVYLRDKKLSRGFLVFSGAAVLVCFINPYGWKGFVFPFEQMAALKGSSIFKTAIRELQSPFSASLYKDGFLNAFFHQWIFFDLFTVIAALSLVIGFRKLKVHDWMIFLIFFYFAYSATKNIGYFIFAVTPIVALGFSRNGKTDGKKKDPFPLKSFFNKYAAGISILFAVVCVLLVLLIRTNAFYIHYRSSYRFGLGWSNSNLPVKATEFLLRNNLNGKLLNQMDYGGYLEFFTGQKVSIDGRLDFMGESNFNEQVNAVSDEAKQRLISKYDPQIILFSYYITPDWLTYLQRRADWRLGYVDGNAAVYLKSGYAPTVQYLDESTLLSFMPNYTDAQIDLMAREKSGAGLSVFFSTQYYPEEEQNLTAFCFFYGWMNAAKQVTANGIQHATSDYPEMYQNLGSVYFEFKDKGRSLYSYERYLSRRSNDQVQKRVNFLQDL